MCRLVYIKHLQIENVAKNGQEVPAPDLGASAASKPEKQVTFDATAEKGPPTFGTRNDNVLELRQGALFRNSRKRARQSLSQGAYTLHLHSQNSSFKPSRRIWHKRVYSTSRSRCTSLDVDDSYVSFEYAVIFHESVKKQ